MKHQEARETLSDEELLGGSVCLGCSAFVPQGEDKSSHCTCAAVSHLGYLGSYVRCDDCGDVYLDDSGAGVCVDCAGPPYTTSLGDLSVRVEHQSISDQAVTAGDFVLVATELRRIVGFHEDGLIHYTPRTETFGITPEHVLTSGFSEDGGETQYLGPIPPALSEDGPQNTPETEPSDRMMNWTEAMEEAGLDGDAVAGLSEK